MDVLAKGLHWGKGLCHLPCKERWESHAFLDCILGLRNKDWVQELSWRCTVFLHTKNATLSLISDCSCSQLGEQSCPCSCPGEKIMRAGVKYSPSFYSGICEVVPSHPVFLVTGFEAPGSAKWEKSQNFWDNGRQRTWHGFEFVGFFKDWSQGNHSAPCISPCEQVTLLCRAQGSSDFQFSVVP